MDGARLLVDDDDGHLYLAEGQALKVSRWRLSADGERDRFERETARARALADGGHVVRVYDSGVLPDGRPYLRTEYCAGGSVADLLRDRAPVPVDVACTVGVAVGRALVAAHRAGLIHGALRPRCVLLRADGTSVLNVFGIAAMVAAGRSHIVLRGRISLAYEPPDRIHGAPATPAGDVYALAAIVYALLQGRPLRFPPDREPDLMEQVGLYTLPVPDLPGIPDALLATLRRALANAPERRHPDPDALADELARCAS